MMGKDFIFRKVTRIAWFINITLLFIAGFIALTLKENATIKLIANITMIATGSIALLIVIPIIIEAVKCNKINSNVKQFLANSDYENGLNYVNNLRKTPLFYDVNQRLFYYKGLFNLYMDNLEIAEDNFSKINLNSNLLESALFLNTSTYLLLIYNENSSLEKIEAIKTCYSKNIMTIKRNENNIRQNKSAISFIENFITSNLPQAKQSMQERIRIPLVKRFIEND